MNAKMWILHGHEKYFVLIRNHYKGGNPKKKVGKWYLRILKLEWILQISIGLMYMLTHFCLTGLQIIV